MSKIYITADSTIDLPAALLEKYDIKTTPLHVFIGEDEYLDGVSINSTELLDKYNETKILPKTSAVPVAEYEEFFGRLTADGAFVVHYSLSSALSSSHQNALIASAGFKGKVFVVDTLLLSTAMALLAVKGCQMRDKGLSAEEIFRRSNDLRSKVKCSFILDKLDFLSKGGRCSALTAFGANILGIKPSIEMNNGKLGVAKKYRGKIELCQLQYINDLLSSEQNIDLSLGFLTFSEGCSEEQLENLRKEIRKNCRFECIETTKAGCTVTAHCGRNTMGFLFMTD